MSGLEVEVARKTYPSLTPGHNHVALENVNFTIPEGQFACILGPSGCGKTTLLNIVSGIDSSVEGQVRYSGRPLKEFSTGYMFQTPRLFPWLSVLDNVRIVMDPEAARSGRAEALLEEMHLGDVMEAFPNRLSGGMQRRVALARAFANQPRLLLMDEPFVSIEAPVADRLRRLLLDIWNAHRTTVLFVTHDLREALFLADRVLFLSPSPGHVVMDMPVDIPRPREGNEVGLERYRQRLLAEHPEILAGLPTQSSWGKAGDAPDRAEAEGR